MDRICYILYALLIKIIFCLRYFLTLSSHAECSIELTRLRNFFSWVKTMPPTSVNQVRLPFLEIIAPPSHHFKHTLCSSASAHTNCPVYAIGANIESCKQIVVYFHGGGFISGNLAAYSGFCEDLVAKLKPHTCILFPEYPLAPEVNLSKIFETGYKTLEWTASLSKPYAVAGDSAGGGVALAAVQRICQTKLTTPSSLVLFSPLCDIEGDRKQRQKNDKTDAFLTTAVVKWSVSKALCGVDPGEINPINGSFSNLCPVLLLCSKDEVLHADALKVYHACQKEKIKIHFVEHPTGLHACALYSRFCDEGMAELDLAASFCFAARV